MADFFISYTRGDSHWAEWIAWQLEEAGYTTLIEAWDFRPGSNFVLEMEHAARTAERTIAVLSPAYVNSVYASTEWAAAFAQDPSGAAHSLIPVRVGKCEAKSLLAQIVYVDLVGLTPETARSALLAGVSRGRTKPSHAPEFPVVSRSAEVQPEFPGSASHPKSIQGATNAAASGGNKRRLIGYCLGAALMLCISGITFSRTRRLATDMEIGLGLRSPIPWSGKWSTDFSNEQERLVLANWDGSAGRSLGEGSGRNMKALYITSTQPVLYVPPEKEYSFFDFSLEFETTLSPQQTEVSWIVRSDRSKEHYYRFRLVFPSTENSPAVVRGSILSKSVETGALSVESAYLPFPQPYGGESLVVRLEASGCEFKHKFWLRAPRIADTPAMDKNALTRLLAVAAKPYYKTFSAGPTCLNNGLFGFEASSSGSALRIERVEVCADAARNDATTGCFEEKSK